jgi:hypothetical protein
MQTFKTLSIFMATTIMSAGLLSTAIAADSSKLPFASEVNSCISAVNARIDLQNATRVRHLVKQQDRTGSAFAFTIETSVFAGDSEKRYAAYCVASGIGEPSRFRITEKAI